MFEFSMEAVGQMLFRATAAFGVLLTLARILGRKQLSQLTFFNYVTGITIGSIAADLAGEIEPSFTNAITGIIWWSVLSIIFEYIGLKSAKARVVLDGQPTIVIKDGKIIKKALQRTRLNIDDLSMVLRIKDVFSMKDVHYAILEPNGKLSVLKNETMQPATKKDIQAPATEFRYIPTEIISDGKIVYKNLQELNLDETWVLQQLKRQGFHSPKEIFYAEIQTDGSLYIN